MPKISYDQDVGLVFETRRFHASRQWTNEEEKQLLQPLLDDPTMSLKALARTVPCSPTTVREMLNRQYPTLNRQIVRHGRPRGHYGAKGGVGGGRKPATLAQQPNHEGCPVCGSNWKEEALHDTDTNGQVYLYCGRCRLFTLLTAPRLRVSSCTHPDKGTKR